MERESIDLADKTFDDYNNELLCMVGTLSRILYADEMIQLTCRYHEIIGADTKNEKSKPFHEWFKRQEEKTSASKSGMTNTKNIKSFYIWFKRQALYTISHFIFK